MPKVSAAVCEIQRVREAFLQRALQVQGQEGQIKNRTLEEAKYPHTQEAVKWT
jgi:hypothetical protein